jgi:hypothetical protein
MHRPPVPRLSGVLEDLAETTRGRGQLMAAATPADISAELGV